MKCFVAAIRVEKNNVLIRIVMLLILCVVNTSKWAGALPGRPGTLRLARRSWAATVCNSAASRTTPTPGFRSLLFLFFFFHPLLSMSALQNSCGRKEKKKWW